MVEKIMKPDFWNKAISLLIAIVLWFFVAYSENPQIELWFSGIPITFINEGSLSEKELVRIKDDTNYTVSVKVRGERSAVLSLTASDIVATADLSTVKKAAQISLPISVKFPIDGLTTVDKKPYNITVKTEKIVSREFDIKVVSEGKTKEDITVKDFSLSVEKITVTGGESIVGNIGGCIAKIDVSDIEGNATVQSRIELCDDKGEIISPSELKLSNTYTEILAEVHYIKEVPVFAVIGNISGSVESVKLSKDKIKISGKKEDVEKINELKTDAVDGSGKEKSETVEVKFTLPEGISIYGDEKITAQITLKEDPAKDE